MDHLDHSRTAFGLFEGLIHANPDGLLGLLKGSGGLFEAVSDQSKESFEGFPGCYLCPIKEVPRGSEKSCPMELVPCETRFTVFMEDIILILL